MFQFKMDSLSFLNSSYSPVQFCRMFCMHLNRDFSIMSNSRQGSDTKKQLLYHDPATGLLLEDYHIINTKWYVPLRH